MTVTGVIPGTAGNTLAIDEIDIYDISFGSEDTFFFMGDSITAAAFSRCNRVQPSYASYVHKAHPQYFPAIIDGGVGGVNSSYGVTMIDRWLDENKDIQIWAVSYGTNDAWQSIPPPVFEQNLQLIIDKTKAAGKQPILARIPYAMRGPRDENIQALNQVIDRLTKRYRLTQGPDFYTWFKDHPTELGQDGVHPNETGAISINRLWYHALRSSYTR